MKFQVGDIVLLLHSDEEGEVTEIINKEMVLVKVGDIQFPVYSDQIDFPYLKRFTEKRKEQARPRKTYIDEIRKEKGYNRERVEDGMWLTFFPVIDTDEFGDDVVEELKVHLVNNTRHNFNFDYKLVFQGKPEFELKNNIIPFSDFYIHNVPFEDLNDNPFFEFEFSLTEPDPAKAEICTASIKLKPRQLFAKIEEIRSRNEPGFSYRLFDKYPDRVRVDKIEPGFLNSRFSITNNERESSPLENPRSVVDLHIEKLTDRWQQMSSLQILDIQMKTFEKYYDLAVAHLQPSLIVIHGVGTGRLRDEIHEILKNRKEVKSFINQYDPRFGYGATEIFFQY